MILYRAANLWLRFAEAANHDGRDRLAMSYINHGVSNTWQPNWPAAVPTDVTNYEQSTDPSGRIDPLTGKPVVDVAPYYFDGRMGTYPYYRSLYNRNVGVRARVGSMNVAIDSTRSFNMAVKPRVVTNPVNLVNDTEDLIITESGLETAFEGNRWGDLLRIALRRQATDPNYLANKIGAKFDAAHSPDAGAVKSKLANPANWFLPFKW